MKQGRPKEKARKVVISTSLDPDIAQKLATIAKKNYRSTASQISKIIEDWMTRRELIDKNA
jgi:hypothetical protein